jgi:deoxyribodipyrimidine photo-lyase
VNDRPAGIGRFVLYWMRWSRRAESNHALAWAAELANSLDAPLLALETLSCEYPYASLRLHTFALEGAAERAAAIRGLGAGYCFELQRKRSEPLSAARRLGAGACAVVTDDYPATILSPAGSDAFLHELPIAAYAVDSSCVIPWRTFETRAYAAFSLRPKIHKLLPAFLKPAPRVRLRKPFTDSAGLASRYGTEALLRVAPSALAASCDIDRTVEASPLFRGGRAEAVRRLDRFLGWRPPALLRFEERPRGSGYLPAQPVPALGPSFAH